MNDDFFRHPDRGCNTDRVDADLFFSTIAAEIRQAIAICRRCPFQQRCAAYADDHDEKFGVWGGANRQLPRSKTEKARQDPDPVAVTRVLQEPGSHQFTQLHTVERAAAVSTGIGQGMTTNQLAKQFRRSFAEVRRLIPADQLPPTRAQRVAELERQVRELWEQGRSDGFIALKLGRSDKTIHKVRRRLQLPAHYGPGGRPLSQAVPA